ncbi:MAG: DUF5947 family protein [Chloroflexota bacterium]
MSYPAGTSPAAQDGFAALRRHMRPRPPGERCELCNAGLAAEHAHLLELERRELRCACEACAILFSGQDKAKFRRLPRRSRTLPDFRLTDGQWEAMNIPVGMAFMFHHSEAGRVMAYYPGPAGATESLLDLESWLELVNDNPILKQLEPDVEALLVNRVRGARAYYTVPLDQCYKLVGVIRLGWHGLSGGLAVWDDVQQFFDELQARATPLRQETHA